MPGTFLGITDKGLDVKKGWFDMASLDYSAKPSANMAAAGIPRGRCVHLDASGDFVPGPHATGCAIFLLNGTDDADVSNPGTTTAGSFAHIAVAPTGKMSGLVATGGYEIATTEFVSGSYQPGQLLSATKATAGATVAATDGRLTNASVAAYAVPVVGVVSSGVASNHNGVSALSFWSVWLPRDARTTFGTVWNGTVA